ncbi:MAG TPA: cellulase family glycosylhydrolase, partial [Verrucomicrobiae bacterium]|nr:cellulase family glycosylhydrolase [Verrucomicrobiae bacterium]
WRNGGSVSETEKKEPQVKVEYVTPGMQKLLEVCRAKGAKNVAIAGGLDWAYDLRGVASGHALNDASGNGVVYDSHFYPMKKWFTHGDTKSQDWDRIVLSGGGKYPVLIGEFGDGKDNYESKVIEFAKEHDLPWTAWCLHPGAKPNLIKDWNYTTTDYGAVVKEALQAASSR